ncbi:MAG: pyridoxal phosphate-dependent aminotransferase [bacterium]
MENRIAAALRRARSRHGFIDLIDTNFHACGLAPAPTTLLDAAARYLTDRELRPYRPDPAGLRALREGVSRFYGRDGVDVPPGAIVATASASDSYTHIFRSVAGTDGEVLLPRPGYPLFEEIAARCGLQPRFYDLDPGAGWRIDAGEVAARMGRRTAALVVISPNNPTGSIVDGPTLESLGAACAREGVSLVVDEVFSAFRFGTETLPRPAALCPETLVYTINGTSKLAASPDLKVSWIAVTGPQARVAEAVEALEIENDLYLNASPINQYVAAVLLDEESAFTERVVAEVARRRGVMLDELARLDAAHPGALEWSEPRGGIHLPIVLPDPPLGLDDEELAIGLLEREALSVHPGYLYGVEEPTMLIASYLSPPDVIVKGIRRLERFLSSPGTS